MCRLPFCSKANHNIAAIATRMGDKRSERCIMLFIHEHNRNVDENRGIAKPDFLRNFWEEEKLSLLTKNVEGPVPGGNLMVPPEVIHLLGSQTKPIHFACSKPNRSILSAVFPIFIPHFASITRWIGVTDKISSSRLPLEELCYVFPQKSDSLHSLLRFKILMHLTKVC